MPSPASCRYLLSKTKWNKVGNLMAFVTILANEPAKNSRRQITGCSQQPSEVEFWFSAVDFLIGAGRSDVCAKVTIADFIALHDANFGGKEFYS